MALLLVALIVMIIVDVVFFIMENTNPVDAIHQGKLMQSNSTPLQNINFSELNLFGNFGGEGLSELIDAPNTQLALELLGIFKSGNGDHSAAVVAQRGNAGKVYRIGDRLPGNATLDSVHDHFILINRVSRLEKLTFNEKSFSETSRDQRPKPRTEVSKGEADEKDKKPKGIALNKRRKMESSTTQSKNSPGEALLQLIKTHGNNAIDSTSAVLGESGIALVEGNNLKGYRLNSSNTMLSQVGLKTGDIIVAINGTPLGEASNDAEVLAQALAKKQARIEIKRGTKNLFLTVPIPSR
tara:strand:+ start:5366 stop:6256 length:891 start_codon:yes stop_codon:yes gene_type:complete